MDREALQTWLRVLDDLTHYAILGVARDATPDDVKSAFHLFADTFHPDAHVGRVAGERLAIDRIFKRGNEAYRVLDDPMLRAQYDESLAQGAPPSVASRRSQTMPPPGSMRPGPRRLEDSLKSPSARPFARRAEELAKQGDYKQAKLQLTLARHHEPQSAALDEFLKSLDEKLRK